MPLVNSKFLNDVDIRTSKTGKKVNFKVGYGSLSPLPISNRAKASTRVENLSEIVVGACAPISM